MPNAELPLLNSMKLDTMNPNIRATNTVLLRNHIPINTGENINMNMIVTGILGFHMYGSRRCCPIIGIL